ncbi:hypothetical protein IMSAGC017_01068 [Thomasclavelia cocleata]|uniref:Uncharacterized protein n=1 Tax=Thomasclavelia cocleata TaxID=69824 RepID=A0A829ZCA9_9FIRM|nr:hypothetical protein IMSAGC017_01068 [Thomasclavelia cocleata]
MDKNFNTSYVVIKHTENFRWLKSNHRFNTSYVVIKHT